MLTYVRLDSRRCFDSPPACINSFSRLHTQFLKLNYLCIGCALSRCVSTDESEMSRQRRVFGEDYLAELRMTSHRKVSAVLPKKAVLTEVKVLNPILAPHQCMVALWKILMVYHHVSRHHLPLAQFFPQEKSRR
jgi:hypothetical protein